MLLAKRFPNEDERGRGREGNTKKLAESANLSGRRLREARTVYHKANHLVDLVISGELGLDAAYEQAHRKDLADSIEAERTATEKREYSERFSKLKSAYPDPAELVREERLKLA